MTEIAVMAGNCVFHCNAALCKRTKKNNNLCLLKSKSFESKAHADQPNQKEKPDIDTLSVPQMKALIHAVCKSEKN